MFPNQKYDEAKDKAIAKNSAPPPEEAPPAEEEPLMGDKTIEDLYAIASPEERMVLEGLIEKCYGAAAPAPEAEAPPEAV